MFKSASASPATWLAAAMAVGLCAAPALSQPAADQPTVGELTVTGRYAPTADARSLSAAVSYRDLDLTTEAGRDMLRQRVRTTAQDLCRRLGESGAGGTPIAPSCERDAINKADPDMRVAFANATRRDFAVNPPAAAPMEAAPADTAAAAPAAPAVESAAQPASVTAQTVTNGPVPDTPENRRAYGGPMSQSGRRSAPTGN